MAQQINDNLEVSGNVQVDSNLVVQGTITTDTFNVKNLVTANGSLASVGQWLYANESDLVGKGFTWNYSTNDTQLSYRAGSILTTNAKAFDLSTGSAYTIDNIPVLTATSLGGQVTSSNLTKIGTLTSLKVSGDATISDFAYFNSDSNRFSLGTDEPHASFTILDNNVEIGIGSPAVNLGSIGTYSNHDLHIVTDNLPRITIKSGGNVNIGDPKNGGGVLNVYGTLYATNVVTDYKVERTNPLNFKAAGDQSIYGLGLSWSGSGSTRQLIMMAGPDRLWTSESFDIGPNQSYFINGMIGLTAGGLGDTIISSKLQSVGTLHSLTVGGDTVLTNTSASSLNIGPLSLISTGVVANTEFSITVNSLPTLDITTSQITIGNSSLQNNPVKVFGPLSININNPDPTVEFAVRGDVNIGGKRFTNASSVPKTGEYQLGDICWNTEPSQTGYIGWVCVASGSPGIWAPFGLIGTQAY